MFPPYTPFTFVLVLAGRLTLYHTDHNGVRVCVVGVQQQIIMVCVCVQQQRLRCGSDASRRDPTRINR